MGLSGPDGLRGIKGAKGKDVSKFYCVKRVRIRSFSGPYFPAFGLNKERYTPYLSVFSPNAGKYGSEKLRIWTLFGPLLKNCRVHFLKVSFF